MKIFKKVVLFLCFLSSLGAAAQEYTDQEIGFDAQQLSQKLVQRGVSIQEIRFIIEQERGLKVGMHQQMLFDNKLFSQQTTSRNNKIGNLRTNEEQPTSSVMANCVVSAAEKQALIDFYNATDGPNWNFTWDIQNTEPCDWIGVTVVNGAVTRLNLGSNNITGNIPAALTQLTNLDYIFLRGNNLSGTIPNSIDQLSNLTYINLSANDLTGSLPSSLGNLSNLQSMWLSENSFTGTIPLSLTNLSQIVFFDLSNNDLVGQIPLLANLPDLRYIYLQLNELDNSIPLFSNLPDLQRLYLNNNNLIGSIPVELGNLQNLEHLHLHFNSLIDNIPIELGNLQNLILLNLSYNSLTGSIPAELGDLQNVTDLFLRNNNLSGSIPSELGNMASMQKLFLHFNQLSGIIPLELGNLTNMISLFVEGNQLTGSIPSELTNLINLEAFAFENNNFSGEIPDFTALPLERLTFEGNAYIFEDFESEHLAYESLIPLAFNYAYTPQAKVDQEETLGVLENGTITLTSTALTSTNNSYQWFKDGQPIAGATSKDYVISNATATDAGTYYFEATNSIITGLTLTRNNITLTVDADTCGVSEAQKQALLDLYNSTDGDNWTNTVNNDQPWDPAIPVCDWFGVAVVNGTVTSVQLGNNNLTGSIPASLGDLSGLITLRLNSNNLNGEIPSSLGSLSQLRTLYCRINQLTGTLPTELENLSQLQILDFSGNNLTGDLPTGYGGLSNLRGLELNNNQLTGTIPVSYANLSSLLELKLSQNQLTGNIPPEFGNMTQLEQLYLQGNQLTGMIPPELGTPGNVLDDLNLSNNRLTGGIPTELGNLTNLRFLSLFNNQLTGSIPSELAALTDYVTVNVSANNLSGDVPFFNNAPTMSLFSISDNAFVFSNFEADYNYYEQNINNFLYRPQAKVDRRETLYVTNGSSITLSTNDLTSLNNTYKWYKDGVEISGVTGSSYTIVNFDPALDVGDYWFVASNTIINDLELTRRTITLQEQRLMEDECDILLDSTTDGSFEDCSDDIGRDTHQILGLFCSNWSSFTPAARDVPSNQLARAESSSLQPIMNNPAINEQPSAYTLPIPNSNLTESPNGGVIAGTRMFFGPDLSNDVAVDFESFGTTLNNLTVGAEYVLQFYQTNGTDISEKNSEDDYGGWQVTFGNETQLSPPSHIEEFPQWSLVNLTFTASATSQALVFNAYVNLTGQGTDLDGRFPSKDFFIDGIKVFEIGSSCVQPDAVNDFCSVDGNPTVADLSVPIPDGLQATWYAQETGGNSLPETTLLEDETMYYADFPGNTGSRLVVLVTIDKDAPTGDEVQQFDFQGETPLVSDLDATPTIANLTITWFTSASGGRDINPSTPLVAGQSYFAFQEGGTCALKVTVEDLNGDGECIEVLGDTVDGSFENAAAVASNSSNGDLGASGWIAAQGNPDTFLTPVVNNTDVFIKNFGSSPNGGVCAGALRVGDTTESFSTSIDNLTIGNTYIVEFFQANATHLLDNRLANEALGYWQINFGESVQNSSLIAPVQQSNVVWQIEQFEFVADETLTTLAFAAASSATDLNNAYPVYMLIDGIRVYEKPTNPFTTQCSTFDNQVFCDTPDDDRPTIANLDSPTGSPVTWYSDQVGGAQYFSNEVLADLPSYFIWADDGSGERIPFQIIFDLGAPEGEEYQFFDSADNPILSDIQVEGTNITWHDSFTSDVILPISTPLVNGTIYYAAQDGNACRLPVEVGVGIPEPLVSQFQEFCSNEDPTIGDLIFQSTNPSYVIQWYSADTGGSIFNSTDALVGGQTYYAEQTDGTNVNEQRIPVTVTIRDVIAQGQIRDIDIEVPNGSTVQDLVAFFSNSPGIIWYNDPYNGIAYDTGAQLSNTETYYGRIASNSICDALDVLAVTVFIGEIEEPELITCIKFIPQPNRSYVIGAWAREQPVEAEPAGSASFNEVKESFSDLLSFLTNKILNREEIPSPLVLKEDPNGQGLEDILPFVKNTTDKNLTVYDFAYETELVGDVEKSVGFSFSLSPNNTERFVYLTPKVELEFLEFEGIGYSGEILNNRLPIRNYEEGFEIEYTNVEVTANGKFRITSTVTIPVPDDSHLKVRYPNETTESVTDSGVESQIQLFNYREIPGTQPGSYDLTAIALSYKDVDGNDIVDPDGVDEMLFEPRGAVIDGWQRVQGNFSIPANAAYMKIQLQNNSSGAAASNAYFDDVRVLPFDSNMKSFVYDPITQRLMAELDENNYATFYEYDTEGGLVRVKKETVRGVYTIQETRSGNSKLNITQ